MKKFTFILVALFATLALADTPPPGTIKSRTYDGTGTDSITSTLSGSKQGLDVNVINNVTGVTSNQGTPNGGGANAWWVQGSLGRLWNLGFASDSVTSYQGSTWSVGVNNFPTSFIVSNFPSTYTVVQSSGTNLHADIDNFPSTTTVVQSTAANLLETSYQGGTWTVGATISNFPSSFGATQSGTWTVGRNWDLAYTTDSVTSYLFDGLGNSIHSTGNALNTYVTSAPSSTDFSVNSTLTAVCSTPTSACPAGSYVDLSIHGSASGRFYVTGTYTGLTIAVRCTLDGTNYNGLRFAGGTNGGYSSTAVSPTSGSINSFRMFRLAACEHVQVYATAYSSGTATVQLDVSSPPDIVENVNAGRNAVATAVNNYSSTNVTTSAYVTLITATTMTASELNIFDSSGQTLYLSYATSCGALASTANTILVVPGGNGFIDWAVPSGVCVGIEAQSANATAGVFNATFLQ